MTIRIEEKDKRLVDDIRIDLAQAIVDLIEIKVHDLQSRHAKERAIAGLQKVKGTMDFLGLKHSSMLKCEGINYLIKTLEEGENGQTQA